MICRPTRKVIKHEIVFQKKEKGAIYKIGPESKILILISGPMIDTPFKAHISSDMGFFKVSHNKQTSPS